MPSSVTVLTMLAFCQLTKSVNWSWSSLTKFLGCSCTIIGISLSVVVSSGVAEAEQGFSIIVSSKLPNTDWESWGKNLKSTFCERSISGEVVLTTSRITSSAAASSLVGGAVGIWYKKKMQSLQQLKRNSSLITQTHCLPKFCHFEAKH